MDQVDFVKQVGEVFKELNNRLTEISKEFRGTPINRPDVAKALIYTERVRQDTLLLVSQIDEIQKINMNYH